jgi:hypothetical protein
VQEIPPDLSSSHLRVIHYEQMLVRQASTVGIHHIATDPKSIEPGSVLRSCLVPTALTVGVDRRSLWIRGSRHDQDLHGLVASVVNPMLRPRRQPDPRIRGKRFLLTVEVNVTLTLQADVRLLDLVTARFLDHVRWDVKIGVAEVARRCAWVARVYHSHTDSHEVRIPASGGGEHNGHGKHTMGNLSNNFSGKLWKHLRHC